MNQVYKVRHGGLMRCCLATLWKTMDEAQEPPKEGDKLRCDWCRDNFMIFKDGAWEWEGYEAATRREKWK